jgi:glycosyltransferase involved in cell wall biosynthesis
MFIIFSTAFSIQIFYYLFFYLRIFSLIKKTKEKTVSVPISIVVCARNEAENLKKYLPKILNQNYPDFEVIVVNDCSDDDTPLILNEFKETYKNLYVTTIHQDSNFSHGKKLALTIGIKAAKNDILLLTDADCEPVSEFWAANAVRNYRENTEIVLLYGGYSPEKGFLNRIIRYDTLFSALQYFTFAAARVPYMGVGRNLSYKKSLWIQNKGFSSHSHVISGDDDLFINHSLKKRNYALEISPESFTRSASLKTFEAFHRQKKRHLTTGMHYKFSTKFLLGIETGSRFLFYLSLIILLFYKEFLITVVSLFIARFIIQNFVIGKAATHFQERKISNFILIFDILIPILNFRAWFSNKFSRKKTVWK